MIIDRLLSVLGERIGSYNFELAVLNRAALNLWISALSPNYHGLTSERGQKFAQASVSLLYVVLMLAFVAYPAGIVATSLHTALGDGTTGLEILLTLVSTAIWVFSFFLLVTFSISYKFRPAVLSEPSKPWVPEEFVEMGRPIDFQDGTNGPADDKT